MITQENLKKYLSGVQYKLNYATLESFVYTGEKLLTRKLSSGVITAIKALDEDSQIRISAERTVAWYALVKALPHLSTRIGDMGIVKNTPQGTQPINQWEYKNLLKSGWEMVDDNLEDLYQEMEASAFEPWITPVNKIRKNFFIKTASEMTVYMPMVNDSARLFDNLKYYVGNVERDYIGKEITPELMQALKDEENPDDQQLALIEMIKAVVAPATLYEALPYLSVKVDLNGLRQTEKDDDSEQNMKYKSTVINELKKKLYDDAKAAVNLMKEYLNETASETVFTPYYNKFLNPGPGLSCYKDPKSSVIL